MNSAAAPPSTNKRRCDGSSFLQPGGCRFFGFMLKLHGGKKGIEFFLNSTVHNLSTVCIVQDALGLKEEGEEHDEGYSNNTKKHLGNLSHVGWRPCAFIVTPDHV